MTIYVMTFNELPFQVGLGVDTHVAIQDIKFDFKQIRTISPSLQSFLLSMLEKNPSQRANIL